MKKILLIFFTIGVAIYVAFWFFYEDRQIKTEEVIPVTLPEISVNEKRDEIINTDKIKEIPDEKIEEDVVIPEKIRIDVPFTSQAPYGVWDERHEESCEEASLLMVAKYLSGESLTPEIAEKEIQEMIDFQIEGCGDFKDSDMDKVSRLAKYFYKIENLKVIYDFEKEDIKKELAKGNPVIVPTAGRLLGNPYFTLPGPLYHNLVLIGYDEDNIITNDPGTKRGKGYTYNIDILYNAIHDFPGKKEDIEYGRKAMIIISE